MKFIEKLKFNADGLIPAIVQEEGTGRVLMMAWMNEASLRSTIETGKTHFWSRSRQKYWMKGELSGHTQEVKDLAFDCDGDTLLIQVAQHGAACHEGYKSCFFARPVGGVASRPPRCGLAIRTRFTKSNPAWPSSWLVLCWRSGRDAV